MQRVPPLTANINQACYVCFKEEIFDVVLQKCSRCRRVSYCSVECQKTNWTEHKTFCKAFNALENDSAARMTLGFALADAPSTDIGFLNSIAEEQGGNKARLWQVVARRSLTLTERNLIGWEPRCIACIRTDQDLRMQSAQSQAGTPRTLKPCPDCNTSFYCSDEHWAAVKHAHSKEPCEDGHDGLSQCELNQEICSDIRFANFIASTLNWTGFRWSPERIKSSWTSLEGATWKGEFKAHLKHEFKHSEDYTIDPVLRATSEGLSLPMTILWGLEKLNENDAWTQKTTLIIHLLGAYDLEVMNAQIFEEILHRLPGVQTLKLILCGPEISKIISSTQREEVLDMVTCPNCVRHGRKRTHQHYDLAYHDLAERLGEAFVQPDLAIAFNSGSSQQAVASWRETITLLVERKIPTIFTAYNREEAEAEANLLKGAGAKLVDALGPKKNPWGSLLTKTEPNSLRGFYAVNGWLAGGFK